MLITWRSRHEPASGANVSPVRRTFWISVAIFTLNASTRRLGSETLTLPGAHLVVHEIGDHAVDARRSRRSTAT